MKKNLFKGQQEIAHKPTKFPDNDIGERLKLFRKTRYKMTLAELSSKIAVSQGSLSDLENGNSLPSATTLRGLYYAGCDINWLLTGDDD